MARQAGNFASQPHPAKKPGMRDKAAFLGGLGTCGRELCCTCWLNQFLPVTMAMAREQGLSISPDNLSGPCGHLKCCLRFEHECPGAQAQAQPAKKPGE